MRHYLFILICIFATILVGCHSNRDKNVPNHGYALNCDTLFPTDSYKEILKKQNIRFYNNPIHDVELEEVMCYFNKCFCRYPKDVEDFWHSYYEHDRLNDFKGLLSFLRNDATPNSFEEYMRELLDRYEQCVDTYGFSKRSLLFDRGYIDFYEYDSVIIFTNSDRKVTCYSVKPEYLYDQIETGKLNRGDLIDARGRAPRIWNWSVIGFYTSDSINIQLRDEQKEFCRTWSERYFSVCDSIVTANRLDEKMSSNEIMLYFNKKDKVIKSYFGKSIPDVIVSDHRLKRVLSESFDFADKRTTFVRVPFVIRK